MEDCKTKKTINFILDGCHIFFYAQAPANITLEQLLKQADRIEPEWCACGIRSDAPEWRATDEFKPDIIFTYDDVIKTSDSADCIIHEDGSWRRW